MDDVWTLPRGIERSWCGGEAIEIIVLEIYLLCFAHAHLVVLFLLPS